MGVSFEMIRPTHILAAAGMDRIERHEGPPTKECTHAASAQTRKIWRAPLISLMMTARPRMSASENGEAQKKLRAGFHSSKRTYLRDFPSHRHRNRGCKREIVG